MSFAALIARNVFTRKLRSSLTGFAVAIGIMTVVALGVLTHSLRQTAISVLRTGQADFTVAQKGVSDVLYSALDDSQVAAIQLLPRSRERCRRSHCGGEAGREPSLLP